MLPEIRGGPCPPSSQRNTPTVVQWGRTWALVPCVFPGSCLVWVGGTREPPITFPAPGPSTAHPSSSPHSLPQALWCAPSVRCPGLGAGWGPLTCLLAEPRDSTCLQRLQAKSRLLD